MPRNTVFRIRQIETLVDGPAFLVEEKSRRTERRSISEVWITLGQFRTEAAAHDAMRSVVARRRKAEKPVRYFDTDGNEIPHPTKPVLFHED